MVSQTNILYYKDAVKVILSFSLKTLLFRAHNKLFFLRHRRITEVREYEVKGDSSE